MSSARRPVLWYVHHHGVGHWRQALATSRHLDRPVVFASCAPPPSALGERCRWVELAADQEPAPADPTAGGRLHWAPLGHAGLLRRHCQLLELAEELRPALAVVDISVEVVVLLRTSGLPVISVRLPGRRDDEAHRLGFDLSEHVVATAPAHLGLVPPGPTTHHVGFVSAIGASDVPWRAGGPIVVIAGSGGTRLDSAVADRLARHVPHRGVELVGGRRGQDAVWIDDPTSLLARASVIVGNAGVGTVADAVALGRPLVVVPEDRPFGEQAATAAALARHGLADVVDDPHDLDALVAAVEAAERRGPPDRALARGATGFARLIDETCGDQMAHAS